MTGEVQQAWRWGDWGGAAGVAVGGGGGRGRGRDLRGKSGGWWSVLVVE